MILPELLLSETQLFVRENEFTDARDLVLKHTKIYGVPVAIVAEQIIGRRKAKEKIQTYYGADCIVYPPAINLEQCSSETTALFKCSVLNEELDKSSTFADLTGGLGVDSYFFSKYFNGGFYVEPNADLLEIARHNHQQLGATGITYVNTTAENFLSSSSQFLDFFFIDPSRRTSDNKKVSSLVDCEPNVIHLIDNIFSKTKLLLVKASPLIDIQQVMNELQSIKKAFVVSLDNECKEVLFLCEKNFAGEPEIVAVNISRNVKFDTLSFRFSEEKAANVSFSDPLTYLFEPNSSILKAGAFRCISERYRIHKIHPNTHLYTSDEIIRDFPGRTFRVISEVKPDAKIIKKHFPEGKANVTTRNYPVSVKDLKAKTRLIDGGNRFLIGFSGIQKKFLIAAEKVV